MNGGGYGSRGRRGGMMPMSEINVTPFVDVVLVLLIIFMLTAHVMESGIEIDVPHTQAAKETTKDFPIVAIAKDGTTYLNDKPLNMNLIAGAIKARWGQPKGVYLRADKETIYEVVAQVASILGNANLPVNLVTQPDDETGRRRR
ncbi:MAG TPA: biopolymer transporter ExbD, partial [Verrucomicrobiaceae bacterium]